MKKLRTNVCLLVVAAMLFVIFAGCAEQSVEQPTTPQDTTGDTTPADTTENEPGASDDDENGAAQEMVTVRWLGVLFPGNFTTGIEEDRVIQTLAEKTGVQIDWSMNIGVAETNALIAVLLAANDLPDIVTPINDPGLDDQLIASGQFLELDDLIEQYAPNIVKNASAMLNYNRIVHSNDTGKLLRINMNVENATNYPSDVHISWQVRWDLYKQLGAPDLYSLDDLLDLMVKMQELEPETPDGLKTYGLGYFLGESWGSVMVDRGFFMDNGLANTGSCEAIYIDVHTHNVLPRVTDPNGVFWQSLEFLNRAYRLGLLDPESATQMFGTAIEKAEQQRYHVFPQNFVMGDVNNLLLAQDNNKGYVPLIIQAPDSAGPWVSMIQEVGNHFAAYISKNTPYAIEIIKMFDYCATEEAQILFTNGIEGIDWEWNEQGEGVYIGEKLASLRDRVSIVRESGIGKYTYQMLVFSPFRLSNGTYSNFEFNTEIDQPTAIREFLDHFNITTVSEYGDIMGGVTYDSIYMLSANIPDNTDVGIKNNNVNNYVVTRIARVIFADSESEFRSLKDSMIQELIDLGAEDVIAEYTRIYHEIIDLFTP